MFGPSLCRLLLKTRRRIGALKLEDRRENNKKKRSREIVLFSRIFSTFSLVLPYLLESHFYENIRGYLDCSSIQKSFFYFIFCNSAEDGTSIEQKRATSDSKSGNLA